MNRQTGVLSTETIQHTKHNTTHNTTQHNTTQHNTTQFARLSFITNMTEIKSNQSESNRIKLERKGHE